MYLSLPIVGKKKLETEIDQKKLVPEGWKGLCDVWWLEGAPTPTLLLYTVSRVVFLQLLAKAARWADTVRYVPEDKTSALENCVLDPE